MTLSQVEKLATEVELARAEYEARKAEHDAKHEAAEQRRAEAQAEFDRQTMAEFDEEPLDRAADEANQALSEALKADPLWQAVTRLYTAQRVRANQTGEYNAAASRLGAEPWPFPIRGVWPVQFEELARIASLEAEGQAADIADAHDQARVDAGEKAARRKS